MNNNNNFNLLFLAIELLGPDAIKYELNLFLYAQNLKVYSFMHKIGIKLSQ